MLKSKLGIPFILKDTSGSKGQHNFLIDGQSSFQEACSLAKNEHISLIAQVFIPNNGDYRLLVLGSKARLVIHRRATGSGHLNNISRGSTAKLIDPRKVPKDVQLAALRAAELVGRQVAGVDMVEDKRSGTWYCFEVNDSPQIASGAMTQEKQVAFTEFIHEYLLSR